MAAGGESLSRLRLKAAKLKLPTAAGISSTREASLRHLINPNAASSVDKYSSAFILLIALNIFIAFIFL